MRSEVAAAVLLFACASVARAAEERYGPAEFFKLIDESKTAYEVTMGPVHDPVPDDSCEGGVLGSDLQYKVWRRMRHRFRQRGRHTRRD